MLSSIFNKKYFFKNSLDSNGFLSGQPQIFVETSSGSAWVVQHVHDLRQIDVYVYVCDGGRASVCVCARAYVLTPTHTLLFTVPIVSDYTIGI